MATTMTIIAGGGEKKKKTNAKSAQNRVIGNSGSSTSGQGLATVVKLAIGSQPKLRQELQPQIMMDQVGKNQNKGNTSKASYF